MRVMLIEPDCPIENKYNPAGSIVMPPLGLECIAAHIQDIADTRIIDGRFCPPSQLIKEIQQFRPDYVGISCCFTLEIDIAIALAKEAKENGAITVMGGWHPSLLVEKTLNSPWIDIIVRSEGEFTFRELIQKNSPIGILGISYKQNGQIVNNPDRPLADLNQFHYPARHLRRPEAKIYYGYNGFPFDCMEASRGCPYKCTFCSIHNFYRHTYRHRSVANIMQELREVRKQNRTVYFIDDNFVANPKHVMKLCDAIIRERLNMFFMSTARADMVVRHPEVFKRMAEAGFIMVFLGLESFSDKTLKALNKQILFKQIKSAVKILHNFGFFIQGNVILGANFSDTVEDLQSTIDIAKSLDVDIPTFTILTPYPGTELMEKVIKDNMLISNTWRDFNWVTPTMRYPHLTSDQLKRYHLKAYADVPVFSQAQHRISRVLRFHGFRFYLLRGLNFETFKGIISVFRHRNFRQVKEH